MVTRKKYFHFSSTLVLIIFSHSFGSDNPNFRFGLENISDKFIQKIKGKRIGLITNQTGKDQKGQRNIDILKEKGLSIKAILVPEHGLTGQIPAEKEVPHSTDIKTGIPIISLYKQDMPRKITKELINDFDILIFDIQDCGTRHYTYISHMLETLKAASLFNKEYVILDRPNPLGLLMEGPLVDVTLQSFISIAPIPLRHALTVGELGLFFNKYLLEKPAQLEVIPMKHHARSDGLNNLPFTMLSPNIPNLCSCYGYCFMGMLTAVDPVDVGLQTKHAFQIILLPKRISFTKNQWKKLQDILQKHGIQSTTHTRYHSKNKEEYEGLQIKIEDINKIHAFNAALDIILFFKNNDVSITFKQQFDKLTGTKIARLYVQGEIKRNQLADKINKNLQEFLEKIKPILLYKPEPTPAFFT